MLIQIEFYQCHWPLHQSTDLSKAIPICYRHVMSQDAQEIRIINVGRDHITKGTFWPLKHSKQFNRSTAAKIAKHDEIGKKRGLQHNKLTLKFKNCIQLYWKCSSIYSVSLKKQENGLEIGNAREILFSEENLNYSKIHIVEETWLTIYFELPTEPSKLLSRSHCTGQEL